ERVARSADYKRTAVEPHLSGVNIGHAETAKEKVELAHSLQARHAEDLPLMQGEARVLQFIARGEVARPEHLGRLCQPRPGPRWKGLRDRAADDHLDHLLLAEIADRAGRDVAAVAQDRQTIAERADFSHPMRDEDDGDALPFEAGDQVAEPIDVPARESR